MEIFGNSCSKSKVTGYKYVRSIALSLTVHSFSKIIQSQRGCVKIQQIPRAARILRKFQFLRLRLYILT
ncbi:hypothetical protein Y032_0002g681 [Ancylostoma ceylanicum]|nr:hypothetical protein Y032_0002g681 [Ancylostoma ceylanicum]